MPRTALVTGGTRGIGAAISMALKDAGYKVAANYAGNDDAARGFNAETGIPVYKWSVADYDACAAGIAQVEADLGPVEVLVNNAGITRDAPFHRMTREQWTDVMRTNLDGVFNMTHPLWNGMRERKFGRVITISSINGQKGQFAQANYSAAKAISASPRRWPRKARAPASPSTRSAPATSPPTWSWPCRKRCGKASSPRSPSDGSARPPRSRVAWSFSRRTMPAASTSSEVRERPASAGQPSTG